MTAPVAGPPNPQLDGLPGLHDVVADAARYTLQAVNVCARQWDPGTGSPDEIYPGMLATDASLAAVVSHLREALRELVTLDRLTRPAVTFEPVPCPCGMCRPRRSDLPAPRPSGCPRCGGWVSSATALAVHLQVMHGEV